MKVGIAGLGLMGGSFAKVFAENGDTVLGYDIDKSTLEFAKMNGAVHDELTEENAKDCDLIIVIIYPQAAVEYIKKMAPHFGPKPIVIDGCGVKRYVCDEIFPLSKEYGFRFYGGHPMAGSHNSGFKYSRPTLFKGASMVVVPQDFDDIVGLGQIEEMLKPCQFGKITVTTAAEHDRMIAFTSQMAHLVSNAYIKSPTAGSHKGFSAGSYKDLTRVAYLAPYMWAELFLENKDNMLNEINVLQQKIEEYKTAIENDDMERLVEVLAEGARIKESVDGR